MRHKRPAMDSACSKKSSIHSMAESRSTSLPADSTDADANDASSGCRRSIPQPDFPPGRWGCLMARPLENMFQRSVGIRTTLSSRTHLCSFKPRHYHGSPIGNNCDFGIDEYVFNLRDDESENDSATTIADQATAEPTPNLEDDGIAL